MIRNGDQHSRDYDQLRHIMRPGHADYSGKIRYGGFNDYRGGGHFSGRLTAPLVFAGAVASQILAGQGVVIGSHILRVADVTDRGFSLLGESEETLLALKGETLPVLDKEKAVKMEERILAAKMTSILSAASSNAWLRVFRRALAIPFSTPSKAASVI